MKLFMLRGRAGAVIDLVWGYNLQSAIEHFAKHASLTEPNVVAKENGIEVDGFLFSVTQIKGETIRIDSNGNPV